MTNNPQKDKRTLHIATLAALAFVTASALSAPAIAQEHRGPPGHEDRRGPPGHGPVHYQHQEYRGGPSHRGYVQPRYHYADNVWHRGRWVNTVHDGRPGWWWMVNGSWFYYPQPVYPYPVNPYAPQEVYTPPVIAPPPPPPSEGFTLVVPLNLR